MLWTPCCTTPSIRRATAALPRGLAEVQLCRERCAPEITRRARTALDGAGERTASDGDWLSYAALLVQVDRIVSDLGAPRPE